MPQSRTTRSRAASATKTPLDRFTKSLEAAQKTLADAQKQMGRGSRTLLRDVEKLLKDTRRETTKLSKQLQKDLAATARAAATGQGPTRAGRSTRTSSSRARTKGGPRSTAKRAGTRAKS
jgi:hypothetical protein